MHLAPVSRITPHVATMTSGGEGFCPSSVAAADVPQTGMPPRSWVRQVRRLGQGDRAGLAHHLLGLPPADRRARFGGSVGDEAIRRHCDALDLEDTVCFAALDASGAVVGAAFGFACGGQGRAGTLVEVAVSIDPEYRRRGLGACLAAHVCAAAEERGALGAAFEFHPRNAAIRGLIRHLGGQIAPLAEDCVIPLPVS